MAKRIENLEVVENKRLNDEAFILEISGSDIIDGLRPGQFVQLKVDGSADTFLRRPFSIHDVDHGKSTFKLLIQIAGKGTRSLSFLRQGDKVDIIYPLGNAFTIPPEGSKPLLIGGGCGIAPLLFLARRLKENDFSADILLGFRNKERTLELTEYSQLGKVYISTEDGSLGEKGFVTDHPLLKKASYDIIYCCGPDPMMKIVAQISKKMKTPCEVSLENLMACGIGACLCCVVDTVRGHICTCTDGPVFNTKDLKW